MQLRKEMMDIVSKEFTTEDAIRQLETVSGMQFSNEQLAILRAKADLPTVVNACAGSGKTTIFIYKAILNMLTGQSNGHDTLGVTFSKDAQLEMEDRFSQVRSQLIRAGAATQALLDSQPKFVTFHALFFRLLKSYTPGLRVLVGGEKTPRFAKTFYRVLRSSNYPMDDKEVLDQMFGMRNELINRGWSDDGLRIPQFQDDPDPVQATAPYLNIPSHSRTFFRDYYTIVRAYQDMKTSAGLVDFTDMKVMLYQQMNDDEDARQYFLHQMATYDYVFLDEFQDIDHLQWRLTQLLLSSKAQRNLFVIGDDDQAIYGFRGGTADYIINFTKEHPDAQSFHLSTNYRTGGHILDFGRSLIENNPVRIDKQLQAHQATTGESYFYYANKKTTVDNDPIFQSLLEKVKDPQIADTDIAVLVRHNATRSMVADFLGNHHLYGNLSHPEYILQRNKIYCAYLDLMDAILHSGFQEFYRHLTEIGFSKYKRHVKQVLRAHHKTPKGMKSLFDYLQFPNYDAQDENAEVDTNVLSAVTHAFIQSPPEDSASHVQTILERTYDAVDALLDTYYGYMVSKQYISRNDFMMVRDALRTNIVDYRYKSVAAFFVREAYKDDRLKAVLDGDREKKLDILTLHQAKGLQYKYVYLIGLDAQDFQGADTDQAQLLPSDTSYRDFLASLHDDEPAPSGDDNPRAPQIYHHFWNGSKDSNDEVIPRAAFEHMYNIIVHGIVPPRQSNDQFQYVDDTHYVPTKGHPFAKVIVHSSDESPFASETAKYVDQTTGEILPQYEYISDDRVSQYYQQTQEIYQAVLQNARFVESERRLLYVGVTRSQERMYIDVPDSPSPLLSELKGPHYEIWSEDDA